MVWKKVFILAVFLCVSLWTAKRLLSYVVFVNDESTEPFKWFLKTEKHAEVGDYVLVKGKESDSHTRGKLLTKKILCAYPYSLKKKGLSYYCCSEKTCRFLHKALKKTPRGTVLVPFNPCKGNSYTSECVVKIPEGYYYVGTSSPIGYDSRYLGYFEKKEIKAVLIPLF